MLERWESRGNVLEKIGEANSEELKNIICYSCYKSSKAGKYHTFLVSFILPLSWPE